MSHFMDLYPGVLEVRRDGGGVWSHAAGRDRKPELRSRVNRVPPSCCVSQKQAAQTRLMGWSHRCLRYPEMTRRFRSL